MSSNGNVSEISGSDQNHGGVIDIYPLSCYYFGSKEAGPFKDETLADRTQRMKSKYTLQHTNSQSLTHYVCSTGFVLFSLNYWFFFFQLSFVVILFSYAAYGLRTCVNAVILVSHLVFIVMISLLVSKFYILLVLLCNFFVL
jgi:hypothetical protein